MMFWDIIVSLCAEKNISVNAMCADIGLSNAIATKWKKGAIPHGTTLKKIADYFGVSTEYLLGKEKKETAPSDEETVKLTPHEVKLVLAYRSKPEMQESVNILLGIKSQPDLSEDMAETVNKTALHPIRKN